MICPKCGGNAELSNWGSIIDIDYADYHVECEKCGYHSLGSTEPLKAKEMFEKGIGMQYTNEQWLKQCTTEQLAEWIVSEINERVKLALHDSELNDGDVDADFYMEDSDDWKAWLKQPHTIKE